FASAGWMDTAAVNLRCAGLAAPRGRVINILIKRAKTLLEEHIPGANFDPRPRGQWREGGKKAMTTATSTIDELVNREYKYGFVTEIDADAVPPGLDEDIIRLISAKKNEPDFMLEWRLKAYRHWVKLAKSEAEPKWANVHYPPIDYQSIVYYSAPKPKKKLNSMDEVDPELRATFEKLGISLDEQKRLSGIAVDAVF